MHVLNEQLIQLLYLILKQHNNKKKKREKERRDVDKMNIKSLKLYMNRTRCGMV
jgi:hypothetical protein